MIDTKRLATDAAYWAMIAPEGAEHYFYMTERPIFNSFFALTANESDFAMDDLSGGWSGVKHSGETYHVFSECWHRIPRPQSEWVEYPSGRGKLVASEPDNNGVVIVLDEAGEYRRVAKDNIKPARTKAQRERDELSETIAKASTVLAGVMLEDWQYDKIAEALITDGWRKEP